MEETSLHVRQLGYLHAVPKAPSSQSVGRRVETEPMSRMQKLKAERRHPVLPPLSCPYLVDHLFAVGPSGVGAMGPAPLTFAEIVKYDAAMGGVLQPWECEALRRLSIDYSSERSKGERPDAKPPFGELALPSRADVARKIEELL